jgi:hypothetical protein
MDTMMGMQISHHMAPPSRAMMATITTGQAMLDATAHGLAR